MHMEVWMAWTGKKMKSQYYEMKPMFYRRKNYHYLESSVEVHDDFAF